MDLDKSHRVIDADWCKELAPGGPYFTVSYREGGVNLPEIETLVYLGSTRLDDESGQSKAHFMFQLASSYQKHGDWSELPESQRADLASDAEVMFYAEDNVGGIAEIDGLLVLLNGLRKCMRRGLGWGHTLPEQ